MKNYIKYLILIQLIFISCVPQKFVKRALNEGKNSEYFYDVTIPENSMLSPNNLKAWYQKNENEYLLIDYKTREIWFAGTQRTLVSWFAFVKKEDLNTYNAIQTEKLRQRALEAKMRAEKDQVMSGIILGALALTANSLSNSVSEYVDNVKKGKYSSSSTSRNSNTTSQKTWEKLSDKECATLLVSSLEDKTSITSSMVGIKEYYLGNQYLIHEKDGDFTFKKFSCNELKTSLYEICEHVCKDHRDYLININK